MKARIALLLAVALAAVLLGCPVYTGDGLRRICDSTGCYDCPGGYVSPQCAPVGCAGGGACQNVCSTAASCSAGWVCGRDGACHFGDCSVWGCPAGSQCTLSGGVASCAGTTPLDAGVEDGGSQAAAPDGASLDAATADAATPDGADGAPLDAASGD
jgi:hypothetical protein